MPIKNNTIDKSYLILCEGKDAQLFLINYLNSDALRCDTRFGEDIQVLDFEGIKNLGSYMKNLTNMDNFETVKQILVIRDAETNADGAVDSVRTSFRNNGFPVPEKCCVWNREGSIATAFVLFPSCDENPVNGTLEDLCWDIIHKKDGNVKEDVASFIDEVKANYNSISSHEHKCRLHAYLSTNDKYVSLKIGEAATAGAFDWNSEELLPLKQVIENGF